MIGQNILATPTHKTPPRTTVSKVNLPIRNVGRVLVTMSKVHIF